MRLPITFVDSDEVGSISVTEFVRAWSRKRLITKRDPLPPYRLFAADCVSRFGTVFPDGSRDWVWEGQTIPEKAYIEASSELDKAIAPDESWMSDVIDHVENQRGLQGRRAPGRVKRRIRDKRDWLHSQGAEPRWIVEQGYGPAEQPERAKELLSMLNHVNNASSRFDAIVRRRITTGTTPIERLFSFKELGAMWAETLPPMSFMHIEADDGLYSSLLNQDFSGGVVECDLTGLDLRGADFRMTNLTCSTGLADANLQGAWFDHRTQFPQGFSPAKHRMVQGSPAGEPVHFAERDPTP